MKKLAMIGAVCFVVVLGAVVGGWLYVKSTPQYSFYRLRKAIYEKDEDTGLKYFDIEKIIDNRTARMIASDKSNVLGLSIAASMKPLLNAEFKAAITEDIKNSDAKGVSLIRIFRMVNVVKKGEGGIAFLSWKNEAEPFFKMKKLSGGYWVVIDLMDFEDLVIGDLSGYEEKIGEVPLFIIGGKVKNQSKFVKKHIKIRVLIFDQDKLKVAEKEAICGRIVGREELKKQPVDFFRGEIVVKPPTKEEMRVPSGKAAPFMVIFKDLPSQAKDFKCEIIEAPSLYPWLR
jgi:hypothetical protein